TLLGLDRPDDTRAALRRVREQGTWRSPRYLALAGRAALARREHRSAVGLLGRALDANHADPELRAELALALAGIGEREPPPETDPAPPGTVRQAACLALAGALAAPYVGGGAAIVYLLATDSFISTLFPSIASRFSALPELLRTLFDFAVLGAVIGALLGRRLARLDGGRLAWALGGAVFTYFAARLCATLLLGIPAFQGWVLV